MSGGACKLIIDSEALAGIAAAGQADPKVAKVLNQSKNADQISDLCQALMDEVRPVLDRGRDDDG